MEHYQQTLRYHHFESFHHLQKRLPQQRKCRKISRAVRAVVRAVITIEVRREDFECFGRHPEIHHYKRCSAACYPGNEEYDPLEIQQYLKVHSKHCILQAVAPAVQAVV